MVIFMIYFFIVEMELLEGIEKPMVLLTDYMVGFKHDCRIWMANVTIWKGCWWGTMGVPGGQSHNTFWDLSLWEALFIFYYS